MKITKDENGIIHIDGEGFAFIFPEKGKGWLTSSDDINNVQLHGFIILGSSRKNLSLKTRVKNAVDKFFI